MEPLAVPSTAPLINWEQFMGAKLFAWLGGLALFLGIAFFIKYSFERNLIPPELRVALGLDRKSTRLNSSHSDRSRMPSSA